MLELEVESIWTWIQTIFQEKMDFKNPLLLSSWLLNVFLIQQQVVYFFNFLFARRVGGGVKSAVANFFFNKLNCWPWPLRTSLQWFETESRMEVPRCQLWLPTLDWGLYTNKNVSLSSSLRLRNYFSVMALRGLLRHGLLLLCSNPLKLSSS